MKTLISILAAAALLSACGGSDNDGASSSGGGTTTPPVAMGDAFIASVNTFIAQISETGEAQSIDGITPTSPEDNEPVAV